jgi:oxygen-independent coproporphyrinogen-3 oxidase
VGPRHLYIHVPFCARRCAYCDFSIAVRPLVPVDEYVDGVNRELALRFGAAAAWTLETLYLGGGTPSKLGAPGVSQLLDVVRSRASLVAGAEVTLEANPEDVTADIARAWRDAGITRVSLGAQSFDDAVLAWMHRTHDAAAIGRAVDAARAGGIDEISLDLIFALPSELGRDWDRDLHAALALAPQHLSFYGLTVEHGTPLGRWRDRGQVREAPEESYEREFLRAHDVLHAHGFEHYEVSNYARPGHEARHNSSYWRGVPYGGVGPAAHEFDSARRRWNVGPYAHWLERVRAGSDPMEEQETLDDASRTVEEVYLGLRTSLGLALRDGEAAVVRPWIEAGWGTLSPDARLRLTPTGWLRLDALASVLTASRSRY